MHTLGQQYQNVQYPVIRLSRALLYQSTGSSSCILQTGSSRFGTRRRTLSSVSSNIIRTYIQSHSPPTTGFSRSVELTAKLPSMISLCIQSSIGFGRF